MLSLPQEKKWQIYCSQKGSLGCDTGLSNDPEFYIDSLTQLSGLDYSALRDLEENRQRARSLDSLQIALRTQPNSFVARFMEADGLIKVLDFLAAMDYETRQSSIHTALLGCTKALMNNSVIYQNMYSKTGKVGNIQKNSEKFRNIINALIKRFPY